MGKKAKKGKKGRAAAAAELTREEAREELLALEAIFGEDIALQQDGAALGFKLRVVPHPGKKFRRRWRALRSWAVQGGCRACLHRLRCARPHDVHPLPRVSVHLQARLRRIMWL